MAGNRDLKFVSYKNEQEWQSGITSQIVHELEEEAKLSDTQTLVVPGGTTPGPIFEVLSKSKLDWSNIVVIPSDERCVPSNTPRSNYYLLKQTLLKNRAAKAQAISLYNEQWESSDFQTVNQKISSNLPLSVCVLGMGEDLHTASLFPNSPDLVTAISLDSPHITKVSVPNQPEERITLSLRVLQEAKHIHVIFKGLAKKQNLLASYKATDPREAPILYFASKATFHYVD